MNRASIYGAFFVYLSLQGMDKNFQHLRNSTLLSARYVADDCLQLSLSTMSREEVYKNDNYNRLMEKFIVGNQYSHVQELLLSGSNPLVALKILLTILKPKNTDEQVIACCSKEYDDLFKLIVIHADSWMCNFYKGTNKEALTNEIIEDIVFCKRYHSLRLLHAISRNHWNELNELLYMGVSPQAYDCASSVPLNMAMKISSELERNRIVSLLLTFNAHPNPRVSSELFLFEELAALPAEQLILLKSSIDLLIKKASEYEERRAGILLLSGLDALRERMIQLTISRPRAGSIIGSISLYLRLSTASIEGRSNSM